MHPIRFMRTTGFMASILAVAQTVFGACAAQAGPTWTELAKIPIGTLQEHTTVALSSTQIATIGGLVDGGATTAIVLLYDIPGNTWKRAAPLPVGLNHPNAVAVDGKIYVVGGLESLPGGGTFAWRATPGAWEYDPKTDTWKTLESMPAAEARGSAAVGVFNKTIVLAGGIPGGSGRTVGTVSAFDVSTGKWIAIPEAAKNIPAPRDHVGGAVTGSKFYVVGGRESGLTNVRDTVFILDLTNPSTGWTTSKAKMPTPRGGLSAAVIGSKIYTFGGEGNPWRGHQGVYNQTEVYDSEADSWSILPPMKIPRHGTSAIGLDGKIYIPGGGIVQGVGASDIFDVFLP